LPLGFAASDWCHRRAKPWVQEEWGKHPSTVTHLLCINPISIKSTFPPTDQQQKVEKNNREMKISLQDVNVLFPDTVYEP